MCVCVLPEADAPAQCSSEPPEYKLMFSPVTASRGQPHVQIFSSTEAEKKKTACKDHWKPIIMSYIL